jgi:2'-5' RNA ligase
VARPTKNLRLFVAAYPPADLAQRMLEHLERLPLAREARLVPPQQVHLTLQFIGDVASADRDGVIESVQRAAAGLAGFRLSLQRLAALPERRPARLIAAETDAPATLRELHSRLAVRLANKPRARPGREFRPHMTLCRFPAPVSGLRIAESAAALEGSFDVREIALMRSTLSHQGAAHHALARVRLG